jgi:hypothetical protein
MALVGPVQLTAGKKLKTYIQNPKSEKVKKKKLLGEQQRGGGEESQKQYAAESSARRTESGRRVDGEKSQKR